MRIKLAGLFEGIDNDFYLSLKSFELYAGGEKGGPLTCARSPSPTTLADLERRRHQAALGVPIEADASFTFGYPEVVFETDYVLRPFITGACGIRC